MEITTYEDLANAILALPTERRLQPVQVAQYTSTLSVIELLPGVALATVGALEIAACRSVYNNKYNADDVVLLVDHNSFSEDGAIGYEMFGLDRSNPIYGKGGPTAREQQTAPDQLMEQENPNERQQAMPHGLYVFFIQQGMPEGMTHDSQVAWVKKSYADMAKQVDHADYAKRRLAQIVTPDFVQTTWEEIHERVRERFTGQPTTTSGEHE